MTASKVELRTLSDLFSDLESAEFGNRIEYGTFDGVGGPYRIVFMPYFNSTLGELYDKDGSVVYHRECYGHQDIMKFASNCTEMYSNFNKFIFATYRSTDDKQRMFIDRLDAFSSYHTKNGWWDTFCLSTDDLEETGLYLCELRGYFKDKDGYPIVKVTPLLQLDPESDIPEAMVYSDWLRRNTRDHMYFHGVYSDFPVTPSFSFNRFNTEWIEEYDWHALFEKILKQVDIFSDFEEIKRGLRSPTRSERKAKNDVDLILELSERNAVVAKKLDNYSVKEYIVNIEDRFERLFPDVDADTLNIAEKAEMVENKAEELKAAKKAKVAAERKAKKNKSIGRLEFK